MGRRKRRNNEDDDNGFGAWEGGYMGAKKSKLMEQYEKQTSNEINNKLSDIFKGIAIFVNGYTIPSSEELKYLMALHGGVFHHYQNSETTHIIASILPDTKVKQLGNNVKIVKPAWISDSIEANKLLDYKPYLLYSNQSKTQPKLNLLQQSTSKNDTTICDQQYSGLTANDPNFLNEFYNKSRLHLISTLGTMFKKKITDLREQSDFNFTTAREKFRQYVLENPENENRIDFNKIIMHIDMDCFFVSVGLLTRPELRGKPIAVTHSRVKQDSEGAVQANNSMSEVASCSYEARAMGVKNGMFLGTAFTICPNLQTIPYDFNEYTRISNILYDTVTSYTLEVEAVSCDEMYVDITELLNDTGGSVEQWATYIRTEIREKTKCPCSTGFGSNRLQARLATRSAKPDGQYILEPDYVETYMQNIKISDLPGVGHAHSNQLKEMSVTTCKDLQEISLGQLQSKFGEKTGKYFYDSCRGIDEKKLMLEHERKSISAEINYGIRFQTNKDAIKFFDQLCTEVHSRLINIHKKGKCISLKLMVRAKDAPVQSTKFLGHGICENVTRSSTLPNATDDLNIIKREILSIWKKLNIPPYELRGVGIHISRLEKLSSQKPALPNQLAKFLNNPTSANVTTPATKQIEKYSEIAKSENLTVEKNFPRKGKKKVETNEISKYLQNNRPITSNNKVEIDEDFLNNLPEDIRQEIIKEYKLKDESRKENILNKNSIKSIDKNNLNQISIEFNDVNNEIDQEFLDNLPEDIRLEVIRQSKKETTINKDSVNSTHKNNSIKNSIKFTDKNILNKNSIESNEMSNEIDQEVLNNLPEDIRLEVMHQSKKENIVNTKNTDKNNLFKNSNKIFDKNNLNKISIESNEMSNEIDQEVLNNLPEDIRLEVMHQSKKENINNTNSVKSIIANNLNRNSIKSIEKNNFNRNSVKTNVSNNEIDQEVLNNLPDDIRLEVMRTYNLKIPESKSSVVQKQNNNTKTLQSNENDKQKTKTNTKPSIREHNSESSNNRNKTNKETTTNTFESMDWKDVKMLINDWVTLELTPKSFDIDMVLKYLCQLVYKRKIEILYEFVKYFYRLIIVNKRNCDWHRAYRTIIDGIQKSMLDQYKAKLASCKLIACENCT